MKNLFNWARPWLSLTCICMSVSAGAQIADDLKRNLVQKGVVFQDGFVYALSRGSIRGSNEVAEQVLITVAMRNMAYSLCSLQYASGSSLETSIKGTTLIWSAASSEGMEVIIRAPLQKPQCRIVIADNAVAKSPLPTQEPASGIVSDAVKADSSVKLIDSGFERSNGITVRVFGGEY